MSNAVSVLSFVVVALVTLAFIRSLYLARNSYVAESDGFGSGVGDDGSLQSQRESFENLDGLDNRDGLFWDSDLALSAAQRRDSGRNDSRIGNVEPSPFESQSGGNFVSRLMAAFTRRNAPALGREFDPDPASPPESGRDENQALDPRTSRTFVHFTAKAGDGFAPPITDSAKSPAKSPSDGKSSTNVTMDVDSAPPEKVQESKVVESTSSAGTSLPTALSNMPHPRPARGLIGSGERTNDENEEMDTIDRRAGADSSGVRPSRTRNFLMKEGVRRGRGRRRAAPAAAAVVGEGKVAEQDGEWRCYECEELKDARGDDDSSSERSWRCSREPSTAATAAVSGDRSVEPGLGRHSHGRRGDSERAHLGPWDGEEKGTEEEELRQLDALEDHGPLRRPHFVDFSSPASNRSVGASALVAVGRESQNEHIRGLTGGAAITAQSSSINTRSASTGMSDAVDRMQTGSRTLRDDSGSLGDQTVAAGGGGDQRTTSTTPGENENTAIHQAIGLDAAVIAASLLTGDSSGAVGGTSEAGSRNIDLHGAAGSINRNTTSALPQTAEGLTVEQSDGKIPAVREETGSPRLCTRPGAAVMALFGSSRRQPQQPQQGSTPAVRSDGCSGPEGRLSTEKADVLGISSGHANSSSATATRLVGTGDWYSRTFPAASADERLEGDSESIRVESRSPGLESREGEAVAWGEGVAVMTTAVMDGLRLSRQGSSASSHGEGHDRMMFSRPAPVPPIFEPDTSVALLGTSGAFQQRQLLMNARDNHAISRDASVAASVAASSASGVARDTDAEVIEDAPRLSADTTTVSQHRLVSHDLPTVREDVKVEEGTTGDGGSTVEEDSTVGQDPMVGGDPVGDQDTTLNYQDMTVDSRETTLNSHYTAVNTSVSFQDTTVNSQDTTVNSQDTTVNSEDTTVNSQDATVDSQDAPIQIPNVGHQGAPPEPNTRSSPTAIPRNTQSSSAVVVDATEEQTRELPAPTDLNRTNSGWGRSQLFRRLSATVGLSGSADGGGLQGARGRRSREPGDGTVAQAAAIAAAVSASNAGSSSGSRPSSIRSDGSKNGSRGLQVQLGVGGRRRGSYAVCPVCLEVFQPMDSVTVITCGHAFHWNCVEPWLEQNPRCPCCRQDLNALCATKTAEKPADQRRRQAVAGGNTADRNNHSDQSAALGPENQSRSSTVVIGQQRPENNAQVDHDGSGQRLPSGNQHDNFRRSSWRIRAPLFHSSPSAMDDGGYRSSMTMSPSTNSTISGRRLSSLSQSSHTVGPSRRTSVSSVSSGFMGRRPSTISSTSSTVHELNVPRRRRSTTPAYNQEPPQYSNAVASRRSSMSSFNPSTYHEEDFEFGGRRVLVLHRTRHSDRHRPMLDF